MNRLVDRLSRLPGIGKRSAERLAFHLLKEPHEECALLAQAIVDLKRNTKQCSICSNLADVDPCPICADPQRDRGLVLVVEQPNDLVSIEQTGLYKGVYHVLMGRIAPLDDVGPGDLTAAALVDRVRLGGAGHHPRIQEVIIGTNPSLEGDGTALFLAQELEKLGAKVSRLARGLPFGSQMELVSKAVLADALLGRQPAK
jgi:recombination protein RecR